ELWDEELNTDVHGIGIYTLPEMELPFDDMGQLMAEIRRVVAAIVEHDKFPIVLGGEHSITSPVVAAMAAKHPGLSVLEIDAHAAGGLRWDEMLSLLRSGISSRHVVGCDLVELCPIPGIVAPNFLCAKLIYKILTYKFSKWKCRTTEDNYVSSVVKTPGF